MYKSAPSNVKAQVEQDIKTLSYGIFGEENVAFELNNSYLPMIVLHDLNIKYDGLSAQIDYLIITRKINLIIECKNLIGNIEVNNNGDFIRTTAYNGRFFLKDDDIIRQGHSFLGHYRHLTVQYQLFRHFYDASF